MTTAARYAWHADCYDPRLASIRYRLLEPLAALRRAGVPIERYDPSRGGDGYDAIIFSKSHSPRALAIAQAARRAGRRVILDQCDNLFAANRVGHASADRVARLTRMAQLSDRLAFSTAMLAEQVAVEIVGCDAAVSVVPDSLDVGTDASLRPAAWEHAAMSALRRFHHRHAGALHCVWFGKSLGRSSGVAHLAGAMDRLAEFGCRHPVTLTIVSNSWLGYRRSRRDWPVPSHYMPWTLATARAVLALHRVAVIPVECNDYTAGKTMNRPATALLAGLGVVADSIPSYDELRPFITLDDWAGGLERYRIRSPETEATLAAGRAHLVRHYSPDTVARQWRAVLED